MATCRTCARTSSISVRRRLQMIAERRPQSVPRRNQAAALRPRKDPGDRPQILDPVARRTARRSRRDLQLLDVRDRRCQSKEPAERRMLDQLAIGVETTSRQTGPLASSSASGTSDTGRELAAITDHMHLLKMPTSYLRIVISLGQDLALLRESQRTVESRRRQRKNGPCRRPAAATERTAAPVKERQLHTARSRHAMQIRLHSLQVPARRRDSRRPSCCRNSRSSQFVDRPAPAAIRDNSDCRATCPECRSPVLSRRSFRIAARPAAATPHRAGRRRRSASDHFHSQSTVSKSLGSRVMLTIWPPSALMPNRRATRRNVLKKRQRFSGLCPRCRGNLDRARIESTREQALPLLLGRRSGPARSRPADRHSTSITSR